MAFIFPPPPPFFWPDQVQVNVLVVCAQNKPTLVPTYVPYPEQPPKAPAVFKDFSKYSGWLPMCYRFHVDWSKQCRHCGSPNHFGRSCLADLGCTYEECTLKPDGHIINVCYVLHGRCTRCRNRGHRAERCGSKTEAEWEAIFQKYWNLGLKTKNCHGNMHHPWGFFYPQNRQAAKEGVDGNNNLLSHSK
jgi:hypothetical protein